MTPTQICLVIGTIYIAPAMPKPLAVILGVGCIVLSYFVKGQS